MPESKLAVPELGAVEVHGVTRSAFILRGALVAGAVYGAGAISPYVSGALGQGAAGDDQILNFALTLEYLETAFYTEKAKQVGLSGEAQTLASDFGAQEASHVQALTQAIKSMGGTPVASPKFTFPATGERSFLKLAYVLENTGVGAYNGAAPSIQSPQILAAAGSIVQIEARHAAAIALLIGKSPTPTGAFDKPLPKAAVLKAVKPLIA